ncbi:MAG TPA: 4Fe-4S dicluster domain-containing protein [Candidatus Binatia bacterium]|nr:4Fe-4S dicluster domain-containing protein [Candidatus Binatia bacterium]
MVAESVLAAREKSWNGAVSLEDYALLAPSEIGSLISTLAREGYAVLGPTVRDGAVVYGPIDCVQDLPQGWSDEQAPEKYRLKPRNDGAFFGYVNSPQSWKKFLHPPEVRLWAAERHGSSFHILNNDAKPEKRKAFLGVRACELAAMRIQDRVLLEDRYRDPIYEAHRRSAFLIAVQCTEAASTCFCASMGTGPAASEGADLVMTELTGGGSHRFLVRAGTERGSELLGKLRTTAATEADLRQAEAGVQAAADGQVRSIDQAGIQELLYQNFEHPRWEHVAARCLSCTNCTMVCPTCFCTTVEDTSSVAGDRAERWRKWDSCFTMAFSYIHGGSVRNSSKSRYRQWITHKLAAWKDQFGSSGCVGCGRCITWCPVGIDITEEVRALRDGGNHGDS